MTCRSQKLYNPGPFDSALPTNLAYFCYKRTWLPKPKPVAIRPLFLCLNYPSWAETLSCYPILEQAVKLLQQLLFVTQSSCHIPAAGQFQLPCYPIVEQTVKLLLQLSSQILLSFQLFISSVEQNQ